MEKLIEIEMKKREEIISNFNTNYLLEAGAGAGKTTIIVERVINHIIKGNINPGNIVAITFTKAASLELAERIQRKAMQCLSKKEYLSQEEDRSAKEKLERVEEIFTGTIHSFCELLLREMPFEAGLTPGYEIIEDSQMFHEKIWYEFLREFEDDYKEDILNLNKFNIDYRDLKDQALAAMDNPDIDFVGFVNTPQLRYKDLEERFKSIDVTGLKASFLKDNSKLARLCGEVIKDKKDFNYYIDQILAEFSKVAEDEDIAKKLILTTNLKSEGVEELIIFLKMLLSIYKDLNAHIYNMCTDFVNRVVKYKKEKYTNSLTFNDLLFRASKLMKNSSKAGEHFKNKFKYFYIDEAQDTDPMQAELLLLLSHHGAIEGLKSLENIKPREGSLFIVGDPKQSIYRFRRADITIYESVKKLIAKSGEVVYLDINFRSTDSICNWVEKTFKNRTDKFGFTEKATKYQAGFEKILSLWKSNKKQADEKKLSGVYGYQFDESIGITEEEYIAAVVDEIINNRYIDEKIGKIDIKTRQIQNKDIMILTKGKAETGRYLNALKERNIPALLAGEKTLGDTREVFNLFLLVDLLIDFKDEIKLVAALRNNFYLEFETINYFLKSTNIEDIISSEENIKALKHPRLKEAFFQLREMIINSKHLRPITFIEFLIKNKIGIYNLHKEYSEIEKRDSDSALVQTLEILKSKDPISLYAIKEELKALIETKVDYELPIDLVFAENAVRIMNIHKAKGLEAEIVILVGKDKTHRFFGDSHYVDKSGDENSGFLVYKSKLGKCPDQDKKKIEERKFLEEELDRLIYVGATRTKSVLITPVTDKKKTFFYPLLMEGLETLDHPDIKNNKKQEIIDCRKIEEEKITKDLIKKMKVSVPSYSKESPSTMDEFKEEASNLELIKDKSTPRGKIYGDIVHRAFEIIFKNRRNFINIQKKDINYAINLSIKESLNNLELDKFVLNGLYPNNTFNLEEIENIENIKDEVKNYLNIKLNKTIYSFINNKEILELFYNSKRVFAEFPFTSSINPLILNKKYNGKRLIVNGYIDLLIELKDGSFVIIDYKTDIVSEESTELFKDRYLKQLEVYKKIIENVLKGKEAKVDNLLIYSTYLDRIIPLNNR